MTVLNLPHFDKTMAPTKFGGHLCIPKLSSVAPTQTLPSTPAGSGRSNPGNSAPRTGRLPGSELAGQRAAVAMSLVQSATLNGLDPWAYLRDVLQRLPTQLNSRIDELLPHCWQP